jgi:hypothetical protein
MSKKYPILYSRTAKGNIQQWQIIAEEDGYYTIEGLQGGTLTTSKKNFVEVKNSGKANATTLAKQAEKEAKAKWSKKLKTGYAESVEAISKIDFKKPMKGDKWKEREDEVIFPITVQDKLNGVRCQNTAEASKSTGGEIFWTIPHIRKALAPIFEKYPNAFIDSEAFNYALRKKLGRLVSIVSVIHKEKDLTPELLAESEQIVQLHVFDGYGFEGITEETPYLQRYEAVKKLVTDLKSKYINILENETIYDLDSLMARFVRNRKKGGEGLMVRWGDCPFKHGRSKYMLKLKHFEDAEFKVLDVQDGNADWKGCAKRIILELNEPSTRGETSFASNIEGDREWLREMYQNKEKVIGKMATCEFQCYSEYKIPQIPYVRAIRTYE